MLLTPKPVSIEDRYHTASLTEFGTNFIGTSEQTCWNNEKHLANIVEGTPLDRLQSINPLIRRQSDFVLLTVEPNC